jgi:hypothetical protein
MRALAHLVAVTALCLCASATAQPFAENFDNVAGLGASGWVLVNNSTPVGSTGWFQGNPAVFPAQTGAATSYLAANFNAAAFGGSVSLWALTPVLGRLRNGDVLTFSTRTESSAPAVDLLEVRLSLNGASADVGTTDTSVGDFTTLLLSVNPALLFGGYPSAWTQFVVPLSGLPPGTSTGRVALRYVVSNTAASGDYIGIDALLTTGTGLLALARRRRPPAR